MRLALFDIDGTLLDARGAGRRAIAGALRDVARIPALEAGYRLDGKTDPQIVEELLLAAPDPFVRHEETLRKILHRYVELLADELERTPARLLPGVARLLTELEAASGLLLGLLSGNIVEGARLKLGSAGLAFDRFRVGAFGSDSPDRMRLPAVARDRASSLVGAPVSASDLVVIGDTPADVRCGLGFGAQTIAVATGRHGVEQLRGTGARHVLGSLEDTEGVVAAILESPRPARPV